MSHISAIENLVEQLKNMGEAPTLLQICTKIIYTLPPHLRGFIATWEALPEQEQTIALLTAKILNEESKNEMFQPQDLGYFAASKGYRGGSRGGYGGRGGHSGGVRNQDGPPTKRARYTGPPCDFCTTMGTTAAHPTSECRKRTHAAKRDSANAAFINSPTVDFGLPAAFSPLARLDLSEWFADSGATAHLTNQKNILQNIVTVPVGSWVIQGIHQSTANVHAYGDVVFESTVNGKTRNGLLKRVLYVPDGGINLISIGAVTALGTQVTFFGEEVSFKKNDVVEVTGRRAGRTLYKLNIKAIIQSIQEEQACVARQSATSLINWHFRLGHVNCKTIQRMASTNAVDGLVITNHDVPQVCEGCIYGKFSRCPFHSRSEKPIEVGQVIVADVGGPMQESSLGGANYYVAFKDKCSGHRQVYFLKNKSEVAGKFKCFVSRFQNETSKLIKSLRTDNGTEFKGIAWTWAEEAGIIRQYTVAYSPQQNGTSERDNRTIVESARSALYGKRHPVSLQVLLRLWAEAIAYSVYTLNRTLSRTRMVTPYEKYHGNKPNISHLRPFGCICYLHIPDKTRRKWDKKGEKGMFLGYDDTSTGFRVLILETFKIKVSVDVTFDEGNVPSTKQQNHATPPKFPFATKQQPDDANQPSDEKDTPSKDNEEASVVPSTQTKANDAQSEQDGNADHQRDELVSDKDFNDATSHEEIPVCANRRYPLRDRKPKVIKSMQSIDVHNSEPFEPRTYQEALSCEEAHLWQPSVQDEYDSHIQNGTWILVPLPPGRKAIGCRWIYKVKPGHLSTPARYKSRLVAKGYAQIEGIDFTETYSPVIGYGPLRGILSMCAALNLDMAQLDIKTAFLYGLVDEEIYIQQPEGFIVPGKEHLVGRLVKCIYGLKQSPRVWNCKFNDFLLKFGFTRSQHDPCVYHRRREEEILVIVIWVDDGLVCSNSKTAIAEVLAFLGENFEMRTLPTDRFVGLEIERIREEKKLFVNQVGFIEKILSRFNMSDCNPKSMPANPHVRLSKEMCPSTRTEKAAMETVPYQQAVGCLNYLTHATRPDIAFAVNQVSRYCHNPGPQHWEAVKHILAYLKGTTQYGICFNGSSGSSDCALVGYTDSDYAGDLDHYRSTTG